MLNAAMYEKGEKVTDRVSLSWETFKQAKRQTRPLTSIEECPWIDAIIIPPPPDLCSGATILWENRWVVDEDGCVIEFIKEYVWHTCPGSGSGSGSGSGGASDINNQVDDSCIRGVVGAALDDDMRNDLLNLFRGYYANVSGRFNAVFQDGVLDPYIDGETYVTGFGRDDQPPHDFYVATITLNESALSNATKEYIMATVYHEMAHAIIDVNGEMGNYIGHTVLASEYVDMIADALVEAFPNLDEIEAEYLAWGGLKDTIVWDSFLTENQQLSIDYTNKQHRQGNGGTSCP